MEKNTEFVEKLVHINRITKVVKGGRRFGFSALVVVGNQNGKIGIAHAKAKQVPDAIKKANEMARRKLIHVPLRDGRTIHHDVKKITLVSASSIDKGIKGQKKNKSELSTIVAETLAKKANEKNIKKIYFDRGIYKYHGRVKIFAETLRKNGMDL